MANSDEKVSKFVQAITDYAEEQRQKIHQEVEDYKIERLTQAEQEVLADAYDLIQRERMELKNNASREMSRRELDARKKLLGKRRDMTETIFAEVKEQLAAYTATPEYRQSLKDSLTAMAARMPAEGTVYEVAPRDEALIPDLTALCPAGSRVETSADIHQMCIRDSLSFERGQRVVDFLVIAVQQLQMVVGDVVFDAADLVE